MGEINKDNLLIWKGAFNDAEFANIAVDKGPFIFDPNDYLDIDLLNGDSATFYIDKNTIEVVSIYEDLGENGLYVLPTRPPYWNVSTERLRVYLPDDGFYQLIVAYRWKDRLGRYSNIGKVYIDFEARATSWIAYPPSARCEKTGGGQNTGQWLYDKLVKQYNDNDTYVLPLLPSNIKNNTFSDPDYIAPVTNLVNCPTSSFNSTVIEIVNLIPANQISPTLTVTAMTFKRTGFPDIVFTLNIPPGQSQTIAVPIATYTSIEMSYFGTGIPTGGFWDYILNITGSPSAGSGTFSANPQVLFTNFLLPYQSAAILITA